MPTTRPIARLGLTAGLLIATFVAGVAPKASAEPAAEPRSKDILGWVEWVNVGPLRLKAKLDTGATTSSLTASNVEIFRKDGKRRVRFVVRDDDRGIDKTLEAPLARHVRIRRHGGNVQRRPVVELGMCIGSVLRKEEFTLIDRSAFVYPVLVGRNYMQDRIIVDPGSTFVQHPECRRQAGQTTATEANPT